MDVYYKFNLRSGSPMCALGMSAQALASLCALGMSAQALASLASYPVLHRRYHCLQYE